MRTHADRKRDPQKGFKDIHGFYIILSLRKPLLFC